MKSQYHVALLGFGTVNQGVYHLIEKWNQNHKTSIHITGILVRDVEKYQTQFPNLSCFTSSIDTFPHSLDAVFSAMGGLEPEHCYVRFFLEKNIPVITANKAVIAKYFKELSSVSSKNQSSLLFEASVGGGVQILKPLYNLSLHQEIKEIEGILNGTSNYILSLVSQGISYTDALLDAQRKGYAEADSSGDLEGFDILNKIIILSNLAFHTAISPHMIHPIPLKPISESSIVFLSEQKRVLRYYAKAKKKSHSLSIDICPCAFPSNHWAQSVKGVKNQISLMGEGFEQLSFGGNGAGMFPTAMSMMSDFTSYIIGDVLFYDTTQNLSLTPEVSGEYYVHTEDKEIIEKYHLVSNKSLPEDCYFLHLSSEESRLEVSKTACFLCRWED